MKLLGALHRVSLSALSAGFTVWARCAGYIDQLLHDRRSAASASRVTLSADVADVPTVIEIGQNLTKVIQQEA